MGISVKAGLISLGGRYLYLGYSTLVGGHDVRLGFDLEPTSLRACQV